MSAITRSQGRKVHVVTIIMIACVIGSCATFSWNCKHHVPYNRRVLLEGLAANPRVEKCEVSGYERGFGWPFDDDYRVQAVFVRLKGRPDTLIAFARVGREIFTGTDHLPLAVLGQFSLDEFDGSNHRPVDVGPGGDFGSMLPFRLRSVDDLIDHYDEFIAFLGTQPQSRDFFAKSDGKLSSRQIQRRETGQNTQISQ